MKVKSFLPCSIALLSLSGCGASDDRIVVYNVGTDDINEVSIETSAESYSGGDLKAGRSITFDRKFIGEGSLDVSWEHKGRKYRKIGCYFATDISTREWVIIKGKAIAISCDKNIWHAK